jgi:antitoxin (DNA-binding transcriptional repressor) of toxin-antitoxin stability system
MHSVNLRQLRNTKQLKIWLKAGETVELRERELVLARIVPEAAVPQPLEWPDAAARRRRIFGERVFDSNGVLDAREDSRY